MLASFVCGKQFSLAFHKHFLVFIFYYNFNFKTINRAVWTRKVKSKILDKDAKQELRKIILCTFQSIGTQGKPSGQS